jgi:hypothetical protein
VAENFDTQIDELYQLPLEEFTKARNALAKTLSGDRKRIVASLAKPTLPMWAINQLHGKDPGTYKALIDAAEKLRSAHRAVLGGKAADLRKSDEVHRAALERATQKTTALLEKAAGSVSPAARDAIRRALATLPGEERPGRLTREPQPAGFSLFAGVKLPPPKPESRKPESSQPESSQPATSEAKSSKAAAPKTQPAKAAPRAVEQAERARARQAERARQNAEREREVAVERARKELKAAQGDAQRATFAVRKVESQLAKARAEESKKASQLREAERRLAELDTERR